VNKGQVTRQKILDIAEASVLSKGFGGTSIDEIIAEAHITKGGFYYHFADKNALAHQMLIRFLEISDQVFDDIFAQGRSVSHDPLQAFLAGLDLFAARLEDLPSGHPGCLIAAICYQERQFDREVVALSAQAVVDWRLRFRGYLDEIAVVHNPRDGVDLDDLAEMLSCVVDGGIILSKVAGDPGRLPRQVRAYRHYVQLVFS
jgi:AcrR family transcriptional regulator